MSSTNAASLATPDSAAPAIDPGLVGLVLVAQIHGLAADPDQLRHDFADGTDALDETALLLAARQIGLKAKLLHIDGAKLAQVVVPALALRDDGKHFLIAKCGADKILVQDLCEGRTQTWSHGEFAKHYQGRLIQFASRATVLGQLAKFDFTWFIPAVVKYRRILLEVLAVSFVLQLFALITPMFFQVVMDKVLVHRGFTTLDVITVGLLFVVIFEVVLSTLRNYVLAHTTSRIDVELGARLFRHVLNLPLAYFEARRVGDTVARVRELENIRAFLTGSALASVLDLFFSVVFLAVMLYYSPTLTLIVALSLPIYAAWSAVLTPMIRRRLDDKFARGAENQSMLVETVHNIGTVKAMAVEPQTTRQWDRQLAAYVSASFRVTRLANIGQQGIQLIQKLVNVATLWFGAHLVIKGELSVGQLIAFNMLANQVAAPVVRLAQLWQEFQQVGVSVERLGDILNSRGEGVSSRMALPPIEGRVQFDQVVFRYKPDAPEALRGISIQIAKGEVLGIVGRSGSGKSTLTKLVQRLYVPERGRVLIDGHDLALADPAWLRRQIGVVLQENMLFNRSIRDNIALSEPGMSLERVIEAARLAGAHEFITELPQGYDTMVGEQGSSLSGGQRQRIAIARALVGNPRILILDEATSALDYESERAVMSNMRAICKGRTVLIIAHRLSTVRQADRIVVIDKGQIAEIGAPDELLTRANSRFAEMHRAQAGTS